MLHGDTVSIWTLKTDSQGSSPGSAADWLDNLGQLNFPVPQFPLLYNRDSSSCLIGSW